MDDLELIATEQGVTYLVRGPEDHGRILDLEIDGRRVWSFPVADDPAPPEERPPGVPADRARFQAWPPSLKEQLSGRFEVGVRSTDGMPAPIEATTEVRLGDGDGPVQLTDEHGRPYVVNKWGRLGHAFADAHPDLVERLLDNMQGIRRLLQDRLGDRVFVSGGTLLGPVRSGGSLIEHDDDADLGYVSRHDHPADIAREGFELGRLLRAAGYQVVRLSAGHLQIHFDDDGVPDHHVDVFTGFLAGGWWYQVFNIRARADEQDLLPPRPVLVEGRQEPAPRRPEVKLEALYGSGWRVPDPSFTFSLPPSTADRFHGWFADYNVDREQWDDDYLLRRSGPEQPEEAAPSPFVAWAAAQSPPGSPVLELGCGTGADARALAAAGRTVHAVDYSRRAIALASAARPRQGGHPAFRVLNLLDLRLVLRLGAELAAQGAGWTLLGRQLLDALEDRGRDNVFRLCAMLLRDGGAAYFDVVADPEVPADRPGGPLTVAGLRREAGRHRLEVVAVDEASEQVVRLGDPEPRLVRTARLTVRRAPERRRSA